MVVVVVEVVAVVFWVEVASVTKSVGHSDYFYALAKTRVRSTSQLYTCSIRAWFSGQLKC
jgi:hypothetical protein